MVHCAVIHTESVFQQFLLSLLYVLSDKVGFIDFEPIPKMLYDRIRKELETVFLAVVAAYIKELRPDIGQEGHHMLEALIDQMLSLGDIVSTNKEEDFVLGLR